MDTPIRSLNMWGKIVGYDESQNFYDVDIYDGCCVKIPAEIIQKMVREQEELKVKLLYGVEVKFDE